MSDHDHDDETEAVLGPEDGEDDEDAEAAAESDMRLRVALSQIRQYGDAVLRMRANVVVVFDEELGRLVERMTVVMHDARGVGLAATQIGVVRRLFVFELDGEARPLVNPVITRTGAEREIDEEGCLSLGVVRVPVERAVEVVIEGKDATGGDVRYELEGMPARVVQHELDHLDGTLIVDRTDPESRKEALSRLRPRLLLGSR
jgi:peptide deformylase